LPFPQKKLFLLLVTPLLPSSSSCSSFCSASSTPCFSPTLSIQTHFPHPLDHTSSECT
jgi:hypothetical protein